MDYKKIRQTIKAHTTNPHANIKLLNALGIDIIKDDCFVA